MSNVQICPYCKQAQKVAGLHRPAAKVDGSFDPLVVRCCDCGKKFEVQLDPVFAQADDETAVGNND